MQARTNRWLCYLQAPGLVAIVDWHPAGGDTDSWLLDLVSTYHDPDPEGDGPWQLP